MAICRRLRIRARLPCGAAGSADHDDGNEPEIRSGIRLRRKVDRTFHWRRQCRIEGSVRDSQGLRARDPSALRRRQVFLRRRSQVAAGRASASAQVRHLPAAARQRLGQMRACGRTRPRHCQSKRRRCRAGHTCGGIEQVRSDDAHGRRVSRIAGRDGALLRQRRRRERRRRNRTGRVLPPAFCRRRHCAGPDRAGAGDRRAARHTRRYLCRGRQTDRQQRSFCAAPRRTRTRTHPDRRRFRAGP